MPTYEYICKNCRKRFNLFFTYAEYGVVKPVCTHCGSEDVARRIGRVRIARSEQSRLDSFADDANLDDLEDDPRELGRMMRSMSKEVGEEMPPEFDEVVNRLEKGQTPEDIERDMPELGEGGAAADFGGSAESADFDE